jgi:hypothetical protein
MTEDTVFHSPWKEWRRKWRDPITLFTLLLVIVGALQWCTLQNTDETLRLQQRAWHAPVGAKLFWIPTKDEPINFRLVLVNSGREPAILFVIGSEHLAGVRIDEVRLRTRQARHQLVFV